MRFFSRYQNHLFSSLFKEEIFTLACFSVSIICRVLKLALSSHDKNIQLCYDPNEQNKETKKIRLHHEGTHILITSAILLLLVNSALYWGIECRIPFYIVAAISIILYLLMVNFFRCPIRLFKGDTEKTVVAPADGRIVVIEEVDEHEYFHDRRLMISIFMDITNVHANWYPVDGVVKHVDHHNGRFMKAWLPKASTENERSMVVIETPEGHTVMARQIAGAVARRIVTYAVPGEDCYIDEHMGFIKFGSRVDVYLPLGTEVCVSMGQKPPVMKR